MGRRAGWLLRSVVLWPGIGADQTAAVQWKIRPMKENIVFREPIRQGQGNLRRKSQILGSSFSAVHRGGGLESPASGSGALGVSYTE